MPLKVSKSQVGPIQNMKSGWELVNWHLGSLKDNFILMKQGHGDIKQSNKSIRSLINKGLIKFTHNGDRIDILELTDKAKKSTIMQK